MRSHFVRCVTGCLAMGVLFVVAGCSGDDDVARPPVSASGGAGLDASSDRSSTAGATGTGGAIGTGGASGSGGAASTGGGAGITGGGAGITGGGAGAGGGGGPEDSAGVGDVDATSTAVCGGLQGFVFCDDFEDGEASDWNRYEQTASAPGAWSVVTETGHTDAPTFALQQSAGGPIDAGPGVDAGNDITYHYLYPAALGGSPWTDQTVSVWIKPNTELGNDAIKVGVCARFTSGGSNATTSGYCFFIRADGSAGGGRLQMSKKLPGGSVVNFPSTVTANVPPFVVGTWYKLTFQVSGSSIVALTGFINDVQLMQMQDTGTDAGPVVSSGGFALITRQAKASFDDVVVSLIAADGSVPSEASDDEIPDAGGPEGGAQEGDDVVTGAGGAGGAAGEDATTGAEGDEAVDEGTTTGAGGDDTTDGAGGDDAAAGEAAIDDAGMESGAFCGPASVFCDDFEDGNAADWSPFEQTASAPGTWTVITETGHAGVATFDLQQSKGGPIDAGLGVDAGIDTTYHYLFPTAPSGFPWTDQTVSAWVKPNTPLGNDAVKVGVCARLTSGGSNATTSGYCFFIRADGSGGGGRLQMSKKLPGGSIVNFPSTVTVNVPAFIVGGWSKLTFVVSGSSIVILTGLINDVPLMQMQDEGEVGPVISSGGPALITRQAQASFDDVLVTVP